MKTKRVLVPEDFDVSAYNKEIESINLRIKRLNEDLINTLNQAFPELDIKKHNNENK